MLTGRFIRIKVLREVMLCSRRFERSWCPFFSEIFSSKNNILFCPVTIYLNVPILWY
jgi:hypothetical protein